LDREDAAWERLAELRQARLRTGAVEQTGATGAAVAITAADDWDRLSRDGRRALIRATVERVLVRPARGAGRISVDLFSE